MKESYVKPSIYMESFALSQTIARSCSFAHTGTLGESNHYNESTCTWKVGDEIYFLDSNSACSQEDNQIPAGMDVPVGAACYNNPDGPGSVFSS